MTVDGKGSLVTTVAVIGGTGKEGSALAVRWALNGYRVLIGSRTEEKATRVAAELNEKLGGEYITGLSNEAAAKEGIIIVLSVPYSAHRATLEGIKDHIEGKIMVDLTVPLAPPNVFRVTLPDGQAASMEAQEFLGEGVRVVAAFQNVSSAKLKDPEHPVACDVLVCGDDAAAREEVIHLVEAAHMRGIDAGPLVNAIAVESLTPVLLYINKTYKVKGAGIRITGIE